MATNTLDFATWNFSNVQLAPIKLKLVASGSGLVIDAGLAAEIATRAAADTTLQANIDEVSQSYAHSLLLGGM